MDEPTLRGLMVEIRMLLPMIMKLSARALEQYLNEQNIGINRMHFGVLMTLRHHQFTLSELSKLFSVDPSSLVPVIDLLEHKSFVERGRDPKDRRRIPLHLTERAVALLDEISQVDQDDPLVKSLLQLGEEKAIQLRDLLREVASAMQEDEGALCEIREHLNLIKSSQQPHDSEIV